jgi:hypothetical protein
MYFLTYLQKKKILYIESAITKDSKLRTSFRDMIIGLFSVEEYSEYLVNASALNKRMTGIVKERLISHVQVLSQSAPIK